VIDNRLEDIRPSHQSGLEPFKSQGVIDVLLAQAETLEHLRRSAECARKRLTAMAVATDTCKAYPDSALAFLNAARVAKAGRQFELAAQTLGIASKLKCDQATNKDIAHLESLLAREREAPNVSLETMAQRLIVYACQRCGGLTEYITRPCVRCGWRPTTLLEIAHSSRLCSNFLSLWQLMRIGREIILGRTAIEAVPNLPEAAAAIMADPRYRRDLEEVHQISQRMKVFETYFFWHEATICKTCGARNFDEKAKECLNCKGPLHLPPPLRLLMCLTRLSLHFQLNFEAPKSTEFDLFIRYLVLLQSKVYRTQETPSDLERTFVLNLITKLARFEVANGLGNIIMTDSNNITYQLPDDLPETKQSLANTVLSEFRDVLQFIANWMSRAKALS
jgi:ribosomal protein L40E